MTYGGYGRDEPTRQPLRPQGRQPVQPAQAAPPSFGDPESIIEQLLEMAVTDGCRWYAYRTRRDDMMQRAGLAYLEPAKGKAG